MHGESEVKSTVGLVTRFRAIRIFFFLQGQFGFFYPLSKFPAACTLTYNTLYHLRSGMIMRVGGSVIRARTRGMGRPSGRYRIMLVSSEDVVWVLLDWYMQCVKTSRRFQVAKVVMIIRKTIQQRRIGI